MKIDKFKVSTTKLKRPSGEGPLDVDFSGGKPRLRRRRPRRLEIGAVDVDADGFHCFKMPGGTVARAYVSGTPRYDDYVSWRGHHPDVGSDDVDEYRNVCDEMARTFPGEASLLSKIGGFGGYGRPRSEDFPEGLPRPRPHQRS